MARALTLGLLCVALGCAGQASGEPTRNVKDDAPVAEPQKAEPRKAEPREQRLPPMGTIADEEEILPVMLPGPSAQEGDEADPEDVPTDPGELRRRAKDELEAGNTEQALAIIDVLLVMKADDSEMLELRGEILIGQGHTEDAMADLKRCCDLGRQSCCR